MDDVHTTMVDARSRTAWAQHHGVTVLLGAHAAPTLLIIEVCTSRITHYSDFTYIRNGA